MIRVKVVAFVTFCLNFAVGLVNVALNRPASQSSTFDSLGVADHGNDGHGGSRYATNVCARTKIQTNPWWMVDFGRKIRTRSIMLTKDATMGYDVFTESFRIGLTDDSDEHLIENLPANTVCYEQTASTYHARRLEIQCSGCGRYLILQVIGSAKVLSFCEVEVYEATQRLLHLINSSPVPSGAHVHFLAIVQRSFLESTTDVAIDVDFGFLNNPVVIDSSQFFRSESSSKNDALTLWPKKSLASLICDPNDFLLATFSYRYPFVLKTAAIARLFRKKTRETLIAVHSNVEVMQSAYQVKAPTVVDVDMVLSPRYASGDIVCFSNCGTYFNPTFRLVLKYRCGTGCKGESLGYTWDAWPSKNCSVLAIDWNADVVSGRYRDFLQAQPGVFGSLVSCQYFFMVTVTEKSRVISSGTYSISILEPLAEFQCEINPLEGYALETQFEIGCTTKNATELGTYRLYTQPCNLTNTRDNRENWLCDSEDRKFHGIYLTEGELSLKYLHCLKVVAVPPHQSSVGVFLNVTVLPMRISQAKQMLLMQDISSEAFHFLSSGNLRESIHHVLVALSLFDRLMDTHVVNDAWHLKMRESQNLLQEIINLARINCTSLSELSLVAMAFAESTKFLMSHTFENIGLYVNAVTGLATALKQMSTRNATLEDIVDNSRYILVGLSNTLSSIFQSGGDSVEEKRIGLNLTAALNTIADAVQSHMTAVDSPVVIQSESISISLVTRSPRHLPGLIIYAESTVQTLRRSNSSLSSRIRIPNDFDVGRYSDQDDDVHIKTLTMAHSPYTVQRTSSKNNMLYSSVLDVTLASGTRRLNITNLTSPVDIFISVPVTPAKWMRVTLETGNVTYACTPLVDRAKSLGLYLFLGDGEKGALTENEYFRSADEIQISVFIIQTSVNLTFHLGEFIEKAENETMLYQQVIPLRDLLRSNLSMPFRILFNDKNIREIRSAQNASSVAVKLLNTMNQTFDLYLMLIELNCLYWSEAEDDWSDHGCRVGDETLPAIVHCQCTHLSAFVITFFVMPNLLDVQKEMLKFTTVWQNPIGVIVVSVVVIIYLLLLIWARRADKLDEKKALPINLVDNPPDSKYAYLVTVYTGSRRGAGTTSDVAIVLKGILADSEAHLLECEDFPVLQRRSIDSFIIRTNRVLGNIYAIHVWHHNTGKWPEWYLSRVVIYDPAEDVQYYFICDAWLAVDIGDCVLDKTFNTATEEEVKQFPHLFPTRTLREFDEHHLWFSIYGKPSQSTFTRIQRLTCCLSLLQTYMLSNIMFYGIQPVANEEKMDVGFATFSWTELLIGFETCLLTFPINIFLAWLFRSIQPRKLEIFAWKVKRRSKPEEPTSSDAQHPEPKPKKRDAFFEKMQSGFRLESTKKPNAKRNADALAAALPRKPNRPSKISFHSCIEAEPISVRKKKRRYLPWWMLFVAYSLVLAIAVVCSFFTILYTFSFGYNKSIRWLTAFIASFFYDLFIGQPLKVIGLAVFFSLIFKRADIECPEDLELNKDEDKDLDFAKYVEEMREANPLYRPPPSSLLVSARRQKELTRKMYAIAIEIVRYVLFMYLVLLITYSQRNPKIYWLNRYLLQTFNLDALTVISNETVFWNWAKGDLIKAIYAKDDSEFLPNKFSYILGSPKFRQLRIRSDTGCLPPKPFNSTRCIGTFSRWNEERRDFVMSWNQMVGETGLIVASPETNKPWLYSRKSDYGGTTWSGAVATYGLGGYVADFGRTPEAATRVLSELQSRDWIDRRTSAVIFELYAYAANVNLISEVTFLIEFPPFGGVVVSKSIASIKLYHYTSGMHIFVLILEAVFIVYTGYFLIREIENAVRDRRSYFTRVWSIFDVATILVSIASIVLFVVQYLEAMLMMQSYGATRSAKFHKMFQIEYFIDFLMGVLICLGMLKFLHLLRFNPLIYKFGHVFRSVGSKILMFCLVLLCVMTAFSGLVYVLTRGQVRPFRSMSKCLSTHFRALLGFFDYDPVRDYDAFLIPMLYIGYSFVSTFCLYSLMIAMFLHGLNEISRRLLPNEESALLWALVGKIKDWFGIKETTGNGDQPDGKDLKRDSDVAPVAPPGDRETSDVHGTSTAHDAVTESSAFKGTSTMPESIQGTGTESGSVQGRKTMSSAVQSDRTASGQDRTASTELLQSIGPSAVKRKSITSDGLQDISEVHQSISPDQHGTNALQETNTGSVVVEATTAKSSAAGRINPVVSDPGTSVASSAVPRTSAISAVVQDLNPVPKEDDEHDDSVPVHETDNVLNQKDTK